MHVHKNVKVLYGCVWERRLSRWVYPRKVCFHQSYFLSVVYLMCILRGGMVSLPLLISDWNDKPLRWLRIMQLMTGCWVGILFQRMIQNMKKYNGYMCFAGVRLDNIFIYICVVVLTYCSCTGDDSCCSDASSISMLPVLFLWDAFLSSREIY